MRHAARFPSGQLGAVDAMGCRMTTLAAHVDTSVTAKLPVVPVAVARAQQVLVLNEFGGPENFKLCEQAIPVPGPGEIRVRVLAASVQFTDTLVRRGLCAEVKAGAPLILGYDVVGEVDALGEGVTAFTCGDRVADLTMTGSYARYRTLPATRVVPLPPSIDPAEAVALVVSWVAAYQLLHREACVQTGQRVLIHGAAGAVGQALMALGKLAGLKMWGTVHAKDVELVRAAGATPISVDVADARTLVPEGFDFVFDGIGVRGFEDSWACVKPGGALVTYGFSSTAGQYTSVLKLGWWLLRLRLWNWWPRGKTTRAYSIMSLRARNPEFYRTDLEKLFGLLREQHLKPRIEARINLGDIANAHRRLEAGGLTGRIIVCPWGDVQVST